MPCGTLKREMMRRFLALLLLLHSVAPADVILNAPRNTALVANDVLCIACGTNSSRSLLRWYHTPSGSNKPSLMNIRETATVEEFREFGLIPGHNGSYDLYTSSVRMHHSGIYTCKVTVNPENDLADQLDASAHLIVLQSTPICETSQNMKNNFIAKGDVIRMSCCVQFSGNWIPAMKWIQKPKDPAKGGFVDHIGNSSVTNSNKDTVTSTLEMTANSSMNGLSFVCETYFEGSPYFEVMGIDMADNVPAYRETWTSGPLNVSFGPKNIVFRPDLEVFSIGDQVTCWADGNPPPAYEWKELETGFTISGRVLTVEKIKPSQKAIYKFKCTAKNNLSSTEDVLIFTIEESANSLPTWIMSGLAAIIGVLLVFIIGGCLIYRRQNKTKEEETMDETVKRKMRKLDDETTLTTANYQPRITDQSPDLVSTSSSSLAGRSSHTYADIEVPIPSTQSQLGNYNELTVDRREQNTVSPVYRGLSGSDEQDQLSPFPARSDSGGPGAMAPAAEGKSVEYYNVCGTTLSGSQDQVVLGSTTSH